MQIIQRKEAKAKGLKFYFTGKPCGRGHVSERQVSSSSCRECAKAYKVANKEELAAQRKIYNEANKDKVAAQRKIYNEANKEKQAARDKIWYEANKEKHAAYQKIYSANNREKVNASTRKNRKKPDVKAADACRKMLKRVLKLTGTSKKGRTFEEIGYTSDELRGHIASQFVEGMSWENYGLHTWHIDHIKPIKAFMDEGIKDPAIINALSNLQPLWAEENLSKGANYLLA